MSFSLADCSACIRLHFDHKTSHNMAKACPTCRAPSEASHIRVSISLREATQAFQRLLPSLKQLVTKLEATKSRQEAGNTSVRRSSLRNSATPAPNSTLGREESKRGLLQEQRRVKQEQSTDINLCIEADDAPAGPPHRRQSPRLPTSAAAALRRASAKSAPASSAGSEPLRDSCECVNEVEDLCSSDGECDEDFMESKAKRQKLSKGSGSGSGSGARSSRGENPHSSGQAANPKPPPQLPAGYCSCPVCGITVRETFVNAHIDACIARPSNKEASRGGLDPARGGHLPSAFNAPSGAAGPSTSRRPPLTQPAGASSIVTSRPAKIMVPPKFVFHLLKDKDVKAKLVAVRLPVDGKVKDWIDRYNSFRRFVESKIDEGTTLNMTELRINFLMQQQKQIAAKKIAAKTSKDMISPAVGGQSHQELIAATRKRQKPMMSDTSLLPRQNDGRAEVGVAALARPERGDAEVRGIDSFDKERGDGGNAAGTSGAAANASDSDPVPPRSTSIGLPQWNQAQAAKHSTATKREPAVCASHAEMEGGGVPSAHHGTAKHSTATQREQAVCASHAEMEGGGVPGALHGTAKGGDTKFSKAVGGEVGEHPGAGPSGAVAVEAPSIIRSSALAASPESSVSLAQAEAQAASPTSSVSLAQAEEADMQGGAAPLPATASPNNGCDPPVEAHDADASCHVSYQSTSAVQDAAGGMLEGVPAKCGDGLDALNARLSQDVDDEDYSDPDDYVCD
eukprot:gene17205-23526_t